MDSNKTIQRVLRVREITAGLLHNNYYKLRAHSRVCLAFIILTIVSITLACDIQKTKHIWPLKLVTPLSPTGYGHESPPVKVSI